MVVGGGGREFKSRWGTLQDAGNGTEEIELHSCTQHGPVVESGGKNVFDQGRKHPKRIHFTSCQKQQRNDEVHALAITNFGIVHAVCRQHATQLGQAVSAAISSGSTSPVSAHTSSRFQRKMQTTNGAREGGGGGRA